MYALRSPQLRPLIGSMCIYIAIPLIAFYDRGVYMIQGGDLSLPAKGMSPILPSPYRWASTPPAPCGCGCGDVPAMQCTAV